MGDIYSTREIYIYYIGDIYSTWETSWETYIVHGRYIKYMGDIYSTWEIYTVHGRHI